MQANDAASRPQATPAAGAGPSHTSHGDNRLLAALAPEARVGLQPYLEKVRLAMKQSLHEPSQRIEQVYFPITSIVSLFAVMANGSQIEVTTVGNEGMVGMPVFLGDGTSPMRAVGQIAGEAWCMPAGQFRVVSRRDGPLRDLLLRYVQAFIDQVNQSVGCARAHSLEQRCARGLLMTCDRTIEDRFHLTQESLASGLGVRRATASGLMGKLRAAGIVRYTRGHVTILDRAALETATCECYHVMKGSYDRLLGPVSTSR